MNPILAKIIAGLKAEGQICFDCGSRHQPDEPHSDHIKLCGKCHTFHRFSEPHNTLD